MLQMTRFGMLPKGLNAWDPVPPSSEVQTMKTKTWTVITNTGKQADLESGLEKKEVQKPIQSTLESLFIG